MSSRIEQIIDEIETFIEGCKYQPLSNSKIIVPKEEIDELIRELRMKTPDEIKRYQKIITNKEAILNEAKRKAEELVEAATVQTNELINEHEIMQQAYAQANEVVELATRQAQEILDTAMIEANSYRSAAEQYTDEILANLETLIGRALNTASTHIESFMNQMGMYGDEIAHSRLELNPPEEEITGEALADEGDVADGLSLDVI